jgi:hypothetical protein
MRMAARGKLGCWLRIFLAAVNILWSLDARRADMLLLAAVLRCLCRLTHPTATYKRGRRRPSPCWRSGLYITLDGEGAGGCGWVGGGGGRGLGVGGA